MKIQVEQLDLLAPWPRNMAMRDGYYAVRVLVRAGIVPIGDVYLRPVRSRTITHDRLRRRIARRCGQRLLEMVGREDAGELNEILDLAGAPRYVRSAFEKSHAPLPPSVPHVTVAVMTRGRDELLAACIANLRRLDYGNFDILVVDGGNDPVPTRETADKLEVRYVRCLTNWPGRARNAAIEHASGEWVAFIDDDCRPEPQWLRELVRPVMNDKNCRCVAGLVQPAALESTADIAFEMHRGLAHRFDEITLRPDFLTASPRRAAPLWRLGSGSNLLVHRQFVRLAGGFDPHIAVAEEAGLFYRALRDDYTVHYAPAAIVHHHRTWTHKALRHHIRAAAEAVAGYHVQRIARYGDLRSLLELAWFRPRTLLRELRRSAKGKSKYPWSLLVVELRGTLAGPWTYAAARIRRTWHGKRVNRQRAAAPATRHGQHSAAAAAAAQAVDLPSAVASTRPPRNPSPRAA